MKLARIMLSLAAAGLVLGAGAVAGGATSASGARPPSVQYANASGDGEVTVGDALEANGQPMRLSLFVTSDGPERVIAYYTASFLERGLLPVTAAGHVSVFDPNDGLQRFISTLPQGKGRTLVLIGTTDPGRPPRLLHAPSSARFPVPAEAHGFLGYRSDDAGARAETGQYLTSLSPAGVAAFYRRELSPRGFREGRSSPALLTFEKSGTSLSIGLQALEANGGAAVFVNLLEGDPRR